MFRQPASAEKAGISGSKKSACHQAGSIWNFAASGTGSVVNAPRRFMRLENRPGCSAGNRWQRGTRPLTELMCQSRRPARLAQADEVDRRQLNKAGVDQSRAASRVTCVGGDKTINRYKRKSSSSNASVQLADNDREATATCNCFSGCN